MSKEKRLLKAILELAQEFDGHKKLSCAEAFKLADEFRAEIIEIGRICNHHNVKIRKCQLGCFV